MHSKVSGVVDTPSRPQAIVDGQLSLDLKERGMALALEAEREEWINAALFALRHFAQRGEFKTEDFRAWYGQEPHDPSCLGRAHQPGVQGTHRRVDGPLASPPRAPRRTGTR